MDGSDGSEYCPFELPEDEYGELMFSRRLENRSVSLVASESRRGSTAVDADEFRPSPGPSRGRRANRARQTIRRTRATRLQAEIEPPKKSTSDRVSVADEDEEMEDVAADEDDGTDAGNQNSEEEDEPEVSSPTAKSTRTRTKQKGKARVTTGTRRGGRRR